MRNLLIGILIGTVATLFLYIHFGSEADYHRVHVDLVSFDSKLAQTVQDSQSLKKELATMSEQIRQLSSLNSDLRNESAAFEKPLKLNWGEFHEDVCFRLYPFAPHFQDTGMNHPGSKASLRKYDDRLFDIKPTRI